METQVDAVQQQQEQPLQQQQQHGGGLGKGAVPTSLSKPPKPESDKQLEDYLRSIYYDRDNPGTYGGAAAIYRTVRREGTYTISLKRIREWLQRQSSYSLFQPARKHFPRPRVITNEKDALWGVDSLNMTFYRESNKGYGYILVAIDIPQPLALPHSTVLFSHQPVYVQQCTDQTVEAQYQARAPPYMMI